MQSRTFLSTKILLFLLMSYLVFLPTGPYPLYVAGLRVEYVLFGLVCAATLPLLGKVHRHLTSHYGRAQLGVFIYLAVISLTTILSDDRDVSARALATTIGYAYLACVIPPLVYRHIDIMREILLWLAGATTAFLIYLYLVLGYGAQQRFTLGDVAARSESDTNYVDPNMTAMGMVMCVVIALPILFGLAQRGGGFRRVLNRVMAVSAIGGALFFESRTAAVSLVAGVAFGFMRAGTGKRRGLLILQRAALVLTVLIIGAVVNRNEVMILMDRLTDLQLDTTGDSGRIRLYEQALQDWMTSGKTELLGNGYYVSNPHNEFIRSLTCDGIVGLIAFIICLMGIYMVCCRGRRYNATETLNQNILFGYITFAMMTYGHTKTMWVAFMFLLIGYLESQARNAEIARAMAGSRTFSAIPRGIPDLPTLPAGFTRRF